MMMTQMDERCLKGQSARMCETYVEALQDDSLYTRVLFVRNGTLRKD